MAETEPRVVDIKTGEVVAVRKASSLQTIWGKQVASHGYAAVPSILIRAQGRLGLSTLQFCLVVHLLEFWWDVGRRPFPSKKELATRMGITEKAIQINMKALEDAGFVRREKRRTAAGDWDTNLYDLDGLVQRVRALEPDFAKEKAAKVAWKTARKDAELPPHRRRTKRAMGS